MRPLPSDESDVNMPTAFKDVVGVLLLVFLLPVWMALGLGAVAVVVARQLYWWARGNTSVVSRLSRRVRSAPLHPPAHGTIRAPESAPLAAPFLAGHSRS